MKISNYLLKLKFKTYVTTTGCLLMLVSLCIYIQLHIVSMEKYNDKLAYRLAPSSRKAKNKTDHSNVGSTPTSANTALRLLSSIIQSNTKPVESNKTRGTTTPERSITNVPHTKDSDEDERPKIEYLKTPTENVMECDSCDSVNETRWTMYTFVKSAIENVERRELIRRTWASLRYVNSGKFLTIFVVGKSQGKAQALVDEEHERYHDILQINTSDTYSLIGMKTLAGMQWVYENTKEEDKFYSTCDDDFLINIGGVQDTIDHYRNISEEKKWPEFPIVCMYQLWEGPGLVFRNEKNKNYVPSSKYKWTMWPKFCPGGMYSTSTNLIKQLYELSRSGEQFLNTDDVWVTGLLRQKLGMPDGMVVAADPSVAKHYNGFANVHSTNKKDYILKEWENIFNKFKTKTLCQC